VGSLDSLFDLTLAAFAHSGNCLGRLPDGRVVFVPYALPGERVRVRLVEEKRGYVRAALLEVLEPSPDRIAPRCPHFFTPLAPLSNRGGWCGGCHFQHTAYETQLAAKTAILKEQLERLGGLQNPPTQSTIPSLPPTLEGWGGENARPWNYRNHVQFHITPTGKLGFKAARSDAVIPISECHLPEPVIDAIWPQIDIAPAPGLQRVSLRLGVDDDVLLAFETDGAAPLDFTVEDLPLSAVQLGPGGSLVLAGSDHVVMEIAPQQAPVRLFRVSAGSFFQTNTPMAAAMVDHLLSHLPLSPTSALLDIYCGVGLFSAFLAPYVGRVIGVERSPSASEDFVVNLDEFDHVELYEADAEAALPALGVKPDLVVVDPPRAGLGSTVLESILALGAPTLAYISCDPATLGRDARRLAAGGYRLVRVTPFDLFPQTYHIESISLWSRL
jgi:23S rRNA (uracil1939-C5)-methyltransferase